jgi:hypothetical protein
MKGRVYIEGGKADRTRPMQRITDTLPKFDQFDRSAYQRDSPHASHDQTRDSFPDRQTGISV